MKRAIGGESKSPQSPLPFPLPPSFSSSSSNQNPMNPTNPNPSKPGGKRKAMKHILKKFHLSTSAPDPTTTSPGSTSTSSVPRPPATPAAGPGGGGSGSQQSSPSSSPAPASGEQEDYFASEEEFQMQLAMAVSASFSSSPAADHDFCLREDADSDQIRAATLLSLRGGRPPASRRLEGEDAGEGLARRYWDYNVLDYDEKVLDGFFDIYGFPNDLASHGKMPSIADLQLSVGDLGFEVVMVNRTIDPALEELLQVAQCISMDCPVAQVSLLVQRIAELVNEHMGGSVRDASVMLARWLERSNELRSSLHTSILPIGCINIGLSRHRALLFKVLADHVGLPCRLVKGSHYTGIDDDAVNIIKSENEREFLVDLMAAPGTLLPADVLSARDASFGSLNSLYGENSGVSGKAPTKRFIDGKHISDTTLSIPSLPSSSSATGPVYRDSGFNRQTTSNGASSLQRADNGVASSVDNVKKKLDNELNLQDNVDMNNLFADLNPFHMENAGKFYPQNKFMDNKVGYAFQKHGQNVVVGPGKPSLPIGGKSRATHNEVPQRKQYAFVEGLSPKNNPSTSGTSGPSIASTSSSSPYNGSVDDLSRVGNVEGSFVYGGPCNTYILQTEKQGGGVNFKKCAETSGANDLEQRENVDSRQNRPKNTNDKFMDIPVITNEKPGLPTAPRSRRLDPMLDVGELEIPWEDLVIGERIGLGSYGEVYHADWNGTEVAVKKFLDQDFSGDALDEFRREVVIMRRLRHPNVVLFMGAVTRPPNLSIVTEFLPRGSLYRILHRPHCQIDEHQRIKMALDVAMGMNCLHTSVPTIVHRDLKSPNLLVDQNWNVKVCDFGLSRLKHNTFLSSKSTAGTPEWMAPEVLRNEPSNEKCDVYSFGVILWELATLRMPWSGMNPMQVVGAVGFQKRRLDIPKEVDPLVERIIWECWQTEPNLRPSFAQLTIALKSLQQLVIPNQQQQLDVQSSSLPQEISVNSTP